MKEEKNKKRHRVGKWPMRLIFGLSGAFIGINGYFKTDYLKNVFSDESALTDKLIFFVLLMAVLYLVAIIHTVAHEAGHLVSGLISGYKFVSFRIGSFILIKKDGKTQLKQFPAFGTGGQCLMAPPEQYSDTRFLLYNLGGVLANLIISVIAIVFCFLTEELLYLFFMILAVMGIGFALINGIPLHLGLADNDGYNALAIGKNEATKRCFWISLRINELVTKEVRLKDMPSGWFAVSDCDGMKSGLGTTISVLACCRAMDAMDFEAAKKIGHELLANAEELIIIHRYIITSEMIFCELIGENRADEIERMFTKELRVFLKVSAANNPSAIRLMYAYELLLKKDEQAADKQLAAFEKAVKKYPRMCEIENERELIAYTQDLYRSRKNAMVGI